MNRIKVMHLLNTDRYSGAENVVISILKHTKNSIDSIYVSKIGDIENKLKKEGVAYYLLSDVGFRSVRKAIKEINPDIIHAHDFTASIIASVVAPKKVKVISHLHNNPKWIKSINLKTVLYYCTTRRYKKIIVVSDSVVKEYCFKKGIEKKVCVLGNPFDGDEIRNKSKHEDNSIKYDLVFIGRMTEQKDPFRFIEIVKTLRDLREQNKNIRVAMVGDGELMNNVKSKINNEKLQDVITLFGFIDNPFPILSDSKIFCLPSKWEGYGLVVLEACALGKPVICSPVGGMINLVDETNGYLCKSVEEFAKKIDLLLNDLKEYNKKSEGALFTAEKYDSKNTKYYQTLKEIYKEL